MHRRASQTAACCAFVCHRRLDRRPQVTAARPLGGEAAGQGTAPQHAGEAARAGVAAGPVEGLGRFNPDEAGTQRTPTASAPQRLASSSTSPLHPRRDPRLAVAASAQQRLLKIMCAPPATCPVVKPGHISPAPAQVVSLLPPGLLTPANPSSGLCPAAISHVVFVSEKAPNSPLQKAASRV